MTARTIVICGSPTALGGHFGGMERAPTLLRELGLRDRLAARPGLAGTTWLDHGDAANDPGWVADPDPRAKNLDRLVGYLGRLAAHVETGLQQADGDAGELLVLGGDCTTHAGRDGWHPARTSGIRLGLAWFDAHGDFNTPDTTPSGNVWGMPFAMACGRGDARLVAAAEGPSVRTLDAGLFGGQVLDETESRMSRRERGRAIRPRGCWAIRLGRQPRPRGRPACRAASTRGTSRSTWMPWTRPENWAIAMPEPDGLVLGAAATAVRAIATSGAPVIGFGATRSWSARVRT
jgi:arginase family enzyme